MNLLFEIEGGAERIRWNLYRIPLSALPDQVQWVLSQPVSLGTPFDFGGKSNINIPMYTL